LRLPVRSGAQFLSLLSVTSGWDAHRRHGPDLAGSRP